MPRTPAKIGEKVVFMMAISVIANSMVITAKKGRL